MTEEVLPDGWASAPLGSLARYLNGRAFSSKTWSTTGRPIIRIQNLTGSGSSFNHFDGELEERHIIRRGDLLVSWAATLGVFVWDGPEAALNQHIFKVLPYINPSYLRYAMTAALDEMYRNTHGSGMVHITKGAFDAVVVPVAPEAEQQRIVDELERRLSHVDAAVSSLISTLKRLDAARASIEYDLFWNTQTPLDKLGQLLNEDGLANGRSVRDKAGGFPVLRLSCLKSGRIDLTEFKQGDWTRSEAEKYIVRQGDFLVSRGNGTLSLVGRGGLVGEPASEVAYPDTLIRMRPDPEKLDPEYLAAVWNSQGVRRQLEAVARTTAGIYKVNQGHLLDIDIPTPPVTEQSELVRDVEQRLSLVDAAQSAVGASLRKAGMLRRSLLVAALRGGLVHQDPNDEPAEFFLKRIRAEHEAGARRKPRGKKVKEPV